MICNHPNLAVSKNAQPGKTHPHWINCKDCNFQDFVSTAQLKSYQKRAQADKKKQAK